ncbi:uncharacterized protein C11orf52-like isoform X2 [Myiozetetes cayanensis]|uniref:uncharacterized protein C11orf52-like isoform X2 n=1 Tax=Myiozetetes cayanensis TaxID=478635 RepID=UPI00215DD7E6|nr:uncharacterized protein C11orf52-like isoform X2 [Myiozetetes cayanensis]
MPHGASTAPRSPRRETRHCQTLPWNSQGPSRNQEIQALPVQRTLGLHGGRSDMGNLCSCGRPWKCPSPFKRKKEKQGTNVRHESRQQQPGRKVPTYEDVPDVPVYATVSKAQGVQQDESIHYADIQVFSKARERSAAEVKNLQLQNATEYATLNFPRARLKYDSKNGTLV